MTKKIYELYPFIKRAKYLSKSVHKRIYLKRLILFSCVFVMDCYSLLYSIAPFCVAYHYVISFSLHLSSLSFTFYLSFTLSALFCISLYHLFHSNHPTLALILLVSFLTYMHFVSISLFTSASVSKTEMFET